MTGSSRHEKSCAAPGATTRHASSRLTRIAASLAVAALAASALNVSTAMARNQWANYHWEFPSGQDQLTINVNNCQDGTHLYGYNPNDHFSGPNANWNTEIGNADTDIVVEDDSCPGLSTNTADPIGTFNDRKVNHIYDATDPDGAGTVNAFNASYGNTGWVGVAIVELIPSSGDNHIVYGEVHLNDYYAGVYDAYNKPLVMRKIQCQEIGHTFGLDHVKKDNSCMYSSMAFIGSDYEPNGHDGGMVDKITHGHGTSEPPPSVDDGGGDDFCDKKRNHRRCLGAGGVFRGKATWAEGYESDDEMFEAADAVVSARVLNGSLFDRVVGAPGRGLPVSQVVLQIQEVFKGNAKGVIRIEHTRGLGLEIEDDPGYVNGDNYLLFLRQLGAKTYRVVNPQGRIAQ